MAIHALILMESELGSLGGGESVTHGLVRGLAAIDRGSDRISLLCPPRLAQDLLTSAGDAVRIITRPAPPPNPGSLLRAALGPLRRPAGKLVRRVLQKPEVGLPDAPPPLDPFILSLQADVIHFFMPLQYATGGPPAVFTVQDLQHEHLPGIFTESHMRYRRALFDAVRRCEALVAISNFTAADFQRHHPVPPEKLFTIPYASYVEPAAADGTLSAEEAARLASLPPAFIFYPALSYRHKNHIALLDALSRIERDSGVRIPLVCTGGRSDHWQNVLARHATLTPQPALIDLGFTSRPVLLALYRRTRFVVFPTLFEGAGLPLLEAIRLQAPIACSDIPPFREFGGDGPAFFDPHDVASMARVIHSFWEDNSARARTVELTSAHRSAALTWETCARRYLAVYRFAAGAPLSQEDHQLLDACRSLDPAPPAPKNIR
ncbi:MAG: glycosyltransferase family 1 protein [Bryobacteraceae bacterium]|nr:glycosyltransferase family 1 protein [Bryobacteraceae bacterium]